MELTKPFGPAQARWRSGRWMRADPEVRSPIVFSTAFQWITCSDNSAAYPRRESIRSDARRREAKGSAAGAQRIENAAPGPAILRQTKPRLILRDSLARRSPDGAVSFADLIAPAKKLLLKLLAFRA